MDNVKVFSANDVGSSFVPKEYIPAGQDQWYLRNEQFTRAKEPWRNLRAHEVESLVKNGNYCDNWDNIYVTNEFEANQIRNCRAPRKPGSRACAPCRHSGRAG